MGYSPYCAGIETIAGLRRLTCGLRLAQIMLRRTPETKIDTEGTGRSTMVLTRGFSEVDGEGKIAIAVDTLLAARIMPGCPVAVKVVKPEGLGRRPYIVVHETGSSSHLSTLEAVALAGEGRTSEEGRLVLSRWVVDEARFVPGDSVELKIRGPQEEPWIVIRNRGLRRAPTLRTSEMNASVSARRHHSSAMPPLAWMRPGRREALPC